MSNLEKGSKLEKSKELEVRDIREEMITDDFEGPLAFLTTNKRDGYHRRVVDASRPGRIEKLLRIGYSVVQDEFKLGGKASHNPSSIDSAVRIHLGGTKEPMGVLMEIPEDIHRLRMKNKEAKAASQLGSVNQTGIPTQVGEITIGQ